MYNSADIFNKINSDSSAIRVHENINHNIFLGKDEKSRFIMFAISDLEPSNITSSNFIEIQTGLRSDGKWVLSFILTNSNYSDLFSHFCDDMIDYAVENIDRDVINSFLQRYIKWQNMLKKNSTGLLSKEAVKGLIGEIHFLINSMVPKYGIEKAVAAWVGMEYNIHDFIVDDLWYEIKSVKNGAPTVTVSTIEQLDCQNDGKLVINYFDDTSIADINKITLNSIILKLFSLINDDSLKIIISDKLLDYGYVYRKEYDTFPFKFIKKEVYNINNTFPAMRRSNIPDAVKNTKYELFITKIQNYKEN